jgi:uncharacterized membrane protein
MLIPVSEAGQPTPGTLILLENAQKIRDFIHFAGLLVDVGGVAVILIGAVVATGAYLLSVLRGQSSIQLYRKNVGRSLLLGLEFLVGGDIIRTVSVAHPDLMDVIVLGAIVAIRTAMSWAMEVEIDGRWPWRGAHPDDDRGKSPSD